MKASLRPSGEMAKLCALERCEWLWTEIEQPQQDYSRKKYGGGEPSTTRAAITDNNGHRSIEDAWPIEKYSRVADMLQPLFRILVQSRFQENADGRRSSSRQRIPLGLAFEDFRKNVGCRLSCKDAGDLVSILCFRRQRH